MVDKFTPTAYLYKYIGYVTRTNSVRSGLVPLAGVVRRRPRNGLSGNPGRSSSLLKLRNVTRAGATKHFRAFCVPLAEKSSSHVFSSLIDLSPNFKASIRLFGLYTSSRDPTPKTKTTILQPRRSWTYLSSYDLPSCEGSPGPS